LKAWENALGEAIMRHDLLDRNRSVLVLIDFQEKLFPHVYEHLQVLARVDLLLFAAKLMKIPMLLTEQYPKGLGSTIEEIRKELPASQPLVKMNFSCFTEPGFKERLASFHRDQILLTGIETHICVAQTALDLAGKGENVFVIADATSSRRPLDAQTSLKRMEQGGVTVTTTEAVVFEWLRCAGTEEFKAIQPKLKALT
jgi:nicotinamidase-related amidase